MRPLAVLALAGTLFGPGTSDAAGDAAPSPLEIYRAAGQTLLHDRIAPQLRRAARGARSVGPVVPSGVGRAIGPVGGDDRGHDARGNVQRHTRGTR